MSDAEETLQDQDIGEPTEGDRKEYARLLEIAYVTGAEEMALSSLDSGVGTYPALVAMAARGTTVEEAYEVLRVAPGDIEETIWYARAGRLIDQEFREDDKGT